MVFFESVGNQRICCFTSDNRFDYERIPLILKKYVTKMKFFIFFLLANRMTALFVKKTFLMISPLASIAKCSFFKRISLFRQLLYGKSCFQNFQKIAIFSDLCFVYFRPEGAFAFLSRMLEQIFWFLTLQFTYIYIIENTKVVHETFPNVDVEVSKRFWEGQPQECDLSIAFSCQA